MRARAPSSLVAPPGLARRTASSGATRTLARFRRSNGTRNNGFEIYRGPERLKYGCGYVIDSLLLDSRSLTVRDGCEMRWTRLSARWRGIARTKRWNVARIWFSSATVFRFSRSLITLWQCQRIHRDNVTLRVHVFTVFSVRGELFLRPPYPSPPKVTAKQVRYSGGIVKKIYPQTPVCRGNKVFPSFTPAFRSRVKKK